MDKSNLLSNWKKKKSWYWIFGSQLPWSQKVSLYFISSVTRAVDCRKFSIYLHWQLWLFSSFNDINIEFLITAIGAMCDDWRTVTRRKRKTFLNGCNHKYQEIRNRAWPRNYQIRAWHPVLNLSENRYLWGTSTRSTLGIFIQQIMPSV